MSEEILNSSLLIGHVRHRRLSPIEHRLNYPMFMPCLDLDELDQLERSVWCFGQRWWHWARFNRQDYLGEGDLKLAVQEKVYQLTGQRLTGRVEAVLHLRYLGIYFSPVNFYYLYDQQGVWRCLLAEVSNTPWNERHYYAVPASSAQRYQHDKAFHVSPFNPIEQKYLWNVKPLTKRLFVHLECHREHKEFDATLTMTKRPLSSKTLLQQLIVTPVMAVKVVTGIYWHAFKLWFKGAPFYSHPKYQTGTSRHKQKRKEVEEHRT